MPSVLITVLNWNGIEDTLECIQALREQTYDSFDILVIENGSSDDSAHRLIPLENSGQIKLLLNHCNLGFAGGVNTGIEYALQHNYDYVALFNNDAIADKNWVSELVKAATENDTAITTGLLLHQDGKTIDSTGDYYSEWGIAFPRMRAESTEKAPASGFVFGASGGASLYKTSLFKEIGLFDKAFFAYYEDVDVSFRTQLAGHKVYYTNKAIAYHKQGATSNKIPGFTVYQTFKNLPLLFAKNVPGLLWPRVGSRFFILYALIFGNALKNGSGKYAIKGWLASVWYFWTKSIWERFHIQSERKVSTKYIDSMLYHDIPPDQTGMRKFRKFFTGKA